MSYNSSMARKGNSIIILIIVALLLGVFQFIRKACKKGRVQELVVSTVTMAGSYFLLYHLNSPLWLFSVPLLIFWIYWSWLFKYEKITSVEANPQWADRGWWWNLDGWEFEEEVAKVFRLNDYTADVTQKVSDGGIDILMYKDNKKIIVQCKHYGEPVSVSVARELNGVRDDFQADELILVASSGVTKSCKDFVSNKPYFKVYDLEDIIRMGLRPIRRRLEQGRF